jgi:hypothetical protein
VNWNDVIERKTNGPPIVKKEISKNPLPLEIVFGDERKREGMIEEETNINGWSFLGEKIVNT